VVDWHCAAPPPPPGLYDQLFDGIVVHLRLAKDYVLIRSLLGRSPLTFVTWIPLPPQGGGMEREVGGGGRQRVD
jgi:hypothetical protein